MPRLLTRREFGLAGAAFIITAHSERTGAAAARNIILGGGSYRDLDTGATEHVLSIVDLDSREQHSTSTSFLPHGIHRKPTDHNCLAVFQKIGPGAFEYDLRNRAIVREIPTAKNRLFYGHGAYTVDGSILLSTETDSDTKDGVISVRDSADLSNIGEFPSYGKEPHECKLIDGGKTLVVTNGGGNSQGAPPSVAYIDIESERLLERVELTNARLNTGHLAVSAAGDLVVVSAPRSGLGKEHLGGVSIRPHGAKMQSIDNPEKVTQRMQGEALSVAVHEKAGIVAVTHPDGGMVTFWSLRNRTLIKTLEIPYPRGVELTVDETSFVVSYGPTANLVRISVDTLQPDESSVIESSFITGSHIYNWSREMTEILSPGPLV